MGSDLPAVRQSYAHQDAADMAAAATFIIVLLQEDPFSQHPAGTPALPYATALDASMPREHVSGTELQHACWLLQIPE